MNDLVNVRLLTQVEDPILTVSLNRHAEVVAAWPEIRHLEAIPKGSLNPLDLCDA